MDNKQREQEALNQDSKQIAELEEQLRESVAAEDFFNLASGKLFVQLANKKINAIIKDITGDKYRKDLHGYNNALSDLNAYKDMLRLMQVAASPKRKQKIKERLEPDE